MRRPPSLSESHLSDYKFLTDKIEPLRLNIVEVHEPNLQIEPIELPAKVAFDYCEYISEYFLRFLLHITMISFFETLFFFQFVSKDEDRGISSISQFYSNKITSSCSNVNKSYLPMINIILDGLFNVTEIVESGNNAAIVRSSSNSHLNTVSWIYFGGLSGSFAFLCVFSVAMKYKIKWNYQILYEII
jgi:hypothetical protein